MLFCPPPLEFIAKSFEANTPVFPQALDGVSEEELRRAPSDHNSSMLWLAGHLVRGRGRALIALGLSADPWDMFGRGTHLDPSVHYPTKQEILHRWAEYSGQLHHALRGLKDGDIKKQAQMPNPPSLDGTVGGQVAFLAFHEAYHIGQLGYVRKWLGHSALAG
jgi:hypothetical protein